MTPRRTLLLAASGAVVLAGGWWLGAASQTDRRAAVAPGTLVFPGLSARLQQAARIEITNKGATLALARSGAVWGIADRGLYPVQQDKLREVLTGLTELRITEPRTADPAQYARLGVDDPKAAATTANLVRVLDDKGVAMAELVVGHRRVRTQGNLPESIYIRRPGEAQSWLAEGRLPVDADPQLWFERDITNIAQDRVARVTATRIRATGGDSVLEFGRVEAKPSLVAPAEHPKLDDYRLEEVFRSLESFTLTDVRPAGEIALPAIGRTVLTTVDGMAVSVEVLKGEKDLWVKLAASGPGAEAIQERVGRWAYQVGAWKEKAFLPTLDELRAEEPEKKPE